MKKLPVLIAILLCALQIGALRIREVSYSADFPFDEVRLRQVSGLRKGAEYSPELLKMAITAMQTELSRQGRHFVKIPYPELIPVSEEELDLSFLLDEIISSRQVSVHFVGMRYFSEAKLKQVLLIGEERRFSIDELPGLMNLILDQYRQRAYLFAKVSLDSLVYGDALGAWLRIEEGKPFKAERYYFEGNQYTRDQTLIKLSGLAQKPLITPQALDQAEQNILRKAYIRDAIIEPIEENSLLIKIEEGKMTYLEGILGINQRELKTELSGLLRLKFLNLWGSDRSISLYWKEHSGSGELELSYHESGLNRFPLSGDLYLYRAVQDSSWIKSQVRAEIYSYFANHRYGIEMVGESIAPGMRRPIIVDKNARRSIGAFWRFDNSRPRINPAKGIEADLVYRIIYSDLAKRFRDAFEADYSTYLRISNRFVTSLGFHLRNLNDTAALDYELYKMGGYSSLRGYGEDEIRSHRLGWANYELRYHLSPQSRAFVFFDHGAYALPLNRFKSDLLALGLGIKVNTRLGILGIAYGLGYRENGFADFGSGMVHAGLDLSF
ncbi:MAG: BamA/TamA family outer membrane protein [Candidatus Cloacimonadaceae bacterium]|nr:BamA/TamA family outer membrane protein [Candidatus Cloacimonadaceae bacterium]